MKHSLISIPIWCDYKPVQPTMTAVETSFQFLYGGIISAGRHLKTVNLCISIPIWCDYKLETQPL